MTILKASLRLWTLDLLLYGWHLLVSQDHADVSGVVGQHIH